VIGEVFHLKNSVGKHRPEEEFAAIRARIARTTERIEKTAWQLDQFGSEKAAGYLRRWLPSIVTFAERTIKGFEAILNLRLVKYANSDHYREFFDDLLNRSTKTTMSCDLTVEATRGKL